LQIGEHMAVDVQRDGDLGVTQELRNDLGIDPSAEEQRRSRMAQVMEADAGQPCFLQERVQLPPKHLDAVEWTSNAVGEDEPHLLPCRPELQALLCLTNTMTAQRMDGGGR